MQRWLSLALMGAMTGCALTNIRADACSDEACATAFGLGSTCDDGFCTDAAPCNTGHDCRRRFGGGACVQGVCSAQLPPDPLGVCNTFEPADLPSRPLAGPGSPQLVGAIYRLSVASDKLESTCPRLATREINATGGLVDGREMAMVLCDGPTDALSDDDRKQRTFAIIDYLSGTLGVPFLVGPPTSFDAINAVTRTVAQRYPTVMISPSATSPALTNIDKKLPGNDPYPLFWRTAPSDVLQAAVLVNDVVGLLPMPSSIANVAIVYVDDAYGQGLEKGFSDGWPPAKGSVSLFPFKGGAAEDWAKHAADVAAANPDAVLMIAVNASDTVAFVTAGLQQGFLKNKLVYTTDGSEDAATLLASSVPASVQQYLTSHLVGTAPGSPDESSQEFQQFAKSLHEEFGVEAATDSFTTNSYDAAYVGALGLVYASAGGNHFDGINVAEGMTNLHNGIGKPLYPGKLDWPAAEAGMTTGARSINLHGISGDLAFNAAGEPATAPIQIWQPANDPAKCGQSQCGGSAPPCICTLQTVK